METDRQTSARVHRVRIQHEEDENRPSPARWEPISMPTSFGKCAATGEPSIAPSTPTVWARRRHPVGNWRKRREFAEDAYAPGIEEFGGSRRAGQQIQGEPRENRRPGAGAMTVMPRMPRAAMMAASGSAENRH